MRFFIEYKQRDWLEWLVIAKFVVNNKIYSATKASPFMANYERELRIEADIRRKRKVEKAIEFVERMRRIQEKAKAVLRKAQKDMKQQTNKGRREAERWEKEDKIILSIKNLVFKKRPTKKLIEKYVGLYVIEKIVSKNAVKLRLPAFMRIHPVVNVSRIVRYRELVKG